MSSSWLSALGGAATALLSNRSTGLSNIPNLPAYGLGVRDKSFDGHSFWSLHHALRRDDAKPVSVFLFDASSPPPSNPWLPHPNSLLPLARNALKKLKTLRHPHILKLLDGSETPSAVYMVTEHVSTLFTRLPPSSPLAPHPEWIIWGLSRIVSALKFINGPGASTHANLRPSSIFLTQSGEWTLSGFELLSSPKDPQALLHSMASLLPDSSRYSSPEIQKSGCDALKDLDPSCLDSYQLYLLIHTLFNNVTPTSNTPPQQRGSIPPALFAVSKRLASPNPSSRLKPEAFWEIGFAAGQVAGGSPGGFFRENRLIKICEGLEAFSLASQAERAALVRSIKDSAESLPPEFLKFRVLPCLVASFDHGADGPTLLPLAISISSSLSAPEFSSILLQPLVKLFASPDRAIRLSLLDLMPQYVEKLDKSVVVDKIWPNLLTGFSDTVPLIREATVKSMLILAPKFSDRILNNDLLRHLAKTQVDVEAGIRTNTCILLGRLAKHLSPSTCRKVLIPAFTRSLRDTFTPARIAGLMALMATVDHYENEDLASKVIPGIGICLLDKEKNVRDQAFRALDMFVERVKKAAAEMPETVATSPLPNEMPFGSNSATASQPGLAMSAAGAAGALAGWAFSSVSRKLTSSDLSTSINNKANSHGAPHGSQAGVMDVNIASLNIAPVMASSDSAILAKAFTLGTTGNTPTHQDTAPSPSATWGGGGDLMDVDADADDWSTFETGPPAHDPSFDPLPSTIHDAMKKGTRNGGPKNQLNLSRPSKGTKLSNAASLVAALEADQEFEESVDDSWGVVPSLIASGSSDAQDSTGSTKPNAVVGVTRQQVNAAPGRSTRKILNNELNVSANNNDDTNDEWGQFDDDKMGMKKTLNEDSLSSEKVITSKDDKAAQMAKMREERRAKMAALKAKKIVA